MVLTEKELRLLLSIILAIYETLYEERVIIREDVIFRALYFEALYYSSPQLLVDNINLSGEELTDAQLSLAKKEIVKLFKELRPSIFNN